MTSAEDKKFDDDIEAMKEAATLKLGDDDDKHETASCGKGGEGEGGGGDGGGAGCAQEEKQQKKCFVKNMCSQKETEYPERDPHHWHDQIVKIKFDEIFGEAEAEVHSFDKVWITTNQVYTQSKYWCYRITSLLLAIPLAAIWGIWFALLSFCRVWCCVPCLKSCDIEMHCFRRLCEILLRTFCAPCFEAAGRCLYHIRVRVIKGDEVIPSCIQYQ